MNTPYKPPMLYDKCQSCGEPFIAPAKNALCKTCWTMPIGERLERDWKKNEEDTKLFNKFRD